MTYRPSFHYQSGRFGAPFAAIFPASIVSGLTGSGLVLAVMLIGFVANGELLDASLSDLAGGLVFTGMALAFGTIGGAFVVAFYILIFGLPIALVLGNRIYRPSGLAVSIATACAASVIATSWMSLGAISGKPEFDWGLLLMISCYSLPAAVIYQKQVIAFMDADPDL